MRITALTLVSVPMQLTEPYTIAYETVSEAVNLFMRVETDSGLSGIGCAAPDVEVTGETAETVTTAFHSFIEPMLLGGDPFRLTFYMEQLKRSPACGASARAMTDMALYDLMARRAGLPLYKLLGGYRRSISTSITIGILPVKETVRRATSFLEDGFHILKIKGGLDVEEDIRRVKEIRSAAGSRIELRFDANQGYTVEQAVYFVEQTREDRVRILEQPTPRQHSDQLGAVSRRTPIAVMADESLMTLRDVFRLTRGDLTDMVNIKLMKVGGISEAMSINSVARAAGVEAMIGCVDESGLAISAGLHLALSRPNTMFADLDGHLDLIGDPYRDAIILRRGRLYPRETPGLGLPPDLPA